MKGLALVAGPFLLAGPATARSVEIGPGADFAGAAASLQPGDILRLRPGHYAACATLRADDITIEGAGDAAAVVLSGRVCQGKAILVAQGSRIAVRNLTLAGAAVPDGNGAGLRAEGGSLAVERVRFIHNQDGILTLAWAPDMVVVVRHSVFERNGACVHACAHAIYAGHIARLSVTDSVFRATQTGHAIKSRARATEVVGCDIADGPTGTGSYLIEAPNGGALLVRGNSLQKGPASGSRVAIAIGAEGVDQPTPFLTITANRFANESGRQAVFVANRTRRAAALSANLLTGPITPLTGPGALVATPASRAPK